MLSCFLPGLPVLAPVYSLTWPHFPWSPDCFMDIVIGFDISTQLPGQLLFHDHPRLQSYLPGILEDMTSIRGVSCGAGTDVQMNVAFKVNDDGKFPTEFQIYRKAMLDRLLQVTVSGPTHLNAQFLQSLWNTFERESTSQGQVLASFSPTSTFSCLFVPPHLYVLFPHHPIFGFPLSLGANHLFRWSWGRKQDNA